MTFSVFASVCTINTLLNVNILHFCITPSGIDAVSIFGAQKILTGIGLLPILLTV